MKSLIYNNLCPVLSSKIMSQTREQVPVILQFKDNIEPELEEIKGLSSQFKSKLPLINGYAAYMTTETVYKLVSSSDIEYISFDSRVYTLLDIATPTMEAYFPHDKGYNGEGITIAVIDTGTAPHKDLTHPNNRIIGFKDLVNGKSEPYDDNGHGTQAPCTVNQLFHPYFSDLDVCLYSFQYILIIRFTPSFFSPISI